MIRAIILGIVAGISGRTLWKRYSDRRTPIKMPAALRRRTAFLQHRRKQRHFKQLQPAVSLLRRGASACGGRLREGWSHRSRLGEAIPHAVEDAGHRIGDVGHVVEDAGHRLGEALPRVAEDARRLAGRRR
jgi:hypothetical protein